MCATTVNEATRLYLFPSTDGADDLIEDQGMRDSGEGMAYDTVRRSFERSFKHGWY